MFQPADDQLMELRWEGRRTTQGRGLGHLKSVSQFDSEQSPRL